MAKQYSKSIKTNKITSDDKGTSKDKKEYHQFLIYNLFAFVSFSLILVRHICSMSGWALEASALRFDYKLAQLYDVISRWFHRLYGRLRFQSTHSRSMTGAELKCKSSRRTIVSLDKCIVKLDMTNMITIDTIGWSHSLRFRFSLFYCCGARVGPHRNPHMEKF